MRNELNDFVSAVANAPSLVEARALLAPERWERWGRGPTETRRGPSETETETELIHARAPLTTNTHGAALSLLVEA